MHEAISVMGVVTLKKPHTHRHQHQYRASYHKLINGYHANHDALELEWI